MDQRGRDHTNRSAAGRIRPRLIQCLAAGLAATGLALALWGAGWLGTWEGRAWDMRARLLSRWDRPHPDIRLILVDQASLDWGREVGNWPWPWPREVQAAIVDYCRRAGARAVAMDILYTEPSVYGVADDAALAAALAAHGATVGAVFLGREAGGVGQWPAEIPVPDFRLKTESDGAGVPPAAVFTRATLPIPEIAAGFRYLSNVQMAPDPDGVYRRLRPFGVFDGHPLPALGLAVFLAGAEAGAPSAEAGTPSAGAGAPSAGAGTPSAGVAAPSSGVGAHSAGGDAHPVEARLAPGLLRIGQRRIPLDAGGEAIARYRGPASVYPAYNAAAVIQAEIRARDRALNGAGQADASPADAIAADLAGKYALVGYSAPGLYDLRPSPTGGVYPGVAIHATFLDNLLSDDFIRSAPPWSVIALTAALALLCSAGMAVCDRPGALAGVGLISLAAPVALAAAAYFRSLWLPLAVMELAMVGAIFGSLAVRYATEGRQKRFIKSAFAQYLSPAVIEGLIRNPDQLKLGGERRTLSIFFSDLEGFTTISEGLPPEALTDLLNTYLSAMTDIITEEGGTVDKYEGDAIIAFWNAPLPLAAHAAHCVRSALRCQRRLAQMRPALAERFGKPLHMRIGMNTGDASVGNFGSQTKFDYTMIGDAVNLAARLEGANKQFGIYTMISEATRVAAGDAFACRRLGRIAVKGREHQPVTVHEPMFREDYESRREILIRFETGLDAWVAGRFSEAGAIFSTIAEADPPAAAYAEMCAILADDPPDAWDGVWVLRTK